MTFVKVINFFLIAGVVQGFGFNLVTLFVKKKFNKAIVFLNLTVLFLSLNNLQRWLIDKGYVCELYVIKEFEVPWYMLIVPMFYAFTIYFFRIQDKVNKFIRLTAALFILELVIRLVLIYLTYYHFNKETTLIDNYHMLEDSFNLIYSMFLFTNTCLLIFKRHNLLGYIMSYDDLNWIKWFVRIGGIVLGLWAVALAYNIYTFDHDIGRGDERAYLPLRFGTSLLLYWIGYQGFFKYTIVRDRISLRSSIETNKVLISDESKANHSQSEGDFFNEKHAADFEKIKSYIIKGKLYLDPLLSMELVASDLGMSKSYFSKLINSYSDYNFSDFINSLRVKQAKKFLSDDDFSDYTIVAIGLECGFNSKSTFYSAFKKFTSVTPTIYRSQF